MTIKFYEDNEYIRSGITLKDPTKPEENNMALHCCQDPEAILKNRQALADTLQTDLQHIVCANQTHSANVHKVTREDFGRGATSANDAIKDTDALYTFEKDVTLCTFTADCVPVTFYEPTSGLIGVIHSGWQGTVKEISSHVMEQLISKEKIDPRHLNVHLGSALSQEKFEVDEDVYFKFKALGYANDFMYFNEQTNKYHIDNQLTVKKQFELAGVPSHQITIDTSCTFIEDFGFSYRQNREDGRHLTFLQRK
ncbi:MAG: peptidoglycan editing factor PgeF [Kurthia sp.]|nr:peptidoglycan editing factor PgeF [Candidatus Kurthia equi]